MRFSRRTTSVLLLSLPLCYCTCVLKNVECDPVRTYTLTNTHTHKLKDSGMSRSGSGNKNLETSGAYLDDGRRRRRRRHRYFIRGGRRTPRGSTFFCRAERPFFFFFTRNFPSTLNTVQLIYNYRWITTENFCSATHPVGFLGTYWNSNFTRSSFSKNYGEPRLLVEHVIAKRVENHRL